VFWFLLVNAVLALSLIGWGRWLWTRLFGSSSDPGWGEAGVLASVFSAGCALFFHLFVPLLWVTPVFQAIGLGLFARAIWLKPRLAQSAGVLVLGVFALSFLGTLSGIRDFAAVLTNPEHSAPYLEYDVMLYHLQSILLFGFESVQNGLAQFVPILSYNSTFHAFSGALLIPGVTELTAFSGNVILISFVLVAAFESLQNSRESIYCRAYHATLLLGACLFSGVLLSSYYFEYGNLGNPISDSAVWAMTLFCVGLALRHDRLSLLWVAIFFLVTSKVSSLPLLLLPLWLSLRFSLLPTRQVLLGLFVVAGVWMLHGALLSGALLFPVSATRIPFLPWTISSETLDGVARAASMDGRVAGVWAWMEKLWEHVQASKPFRKFVQFSLLGILLALPLLKTVRFRPWGGVALVLVLNLTVWVFMLPHVRFVGGTFVALGLLILTAGLVVWSETRPFHFMLRFVPVLAGLALAGRVMLGAVTMPDVFSYPFPRVPEPTVLEIKQASGVVLWRAIQGDRCIDRLLCAPFDPVGVVATRLESGHLYFKLAHFSVP
jgi:hypothetical protein